MLEANGDLFNMSCDALCITTNGYVKTNGNAVMGRGCALQAANLINELPQHLGHRIRTGGNRVHYLMDICDLTQADNRTALVSFPVKPKSVICDGSNVVRHMSGKFKTGHKVPGCFAKAEIKLIEQSANELVQLTDKQGWSRVLLPRPGCGAGELDWDIDVKPVLNEILDDRFTCVTY